MSLSSTGRDTKAERAGPPDHVVTGPVLPKFTPADVVTPQAAMFDAGPFRPGEIAVHATGAVANVGTCVAALALTVPGAEPGPLALVTVPACALAGWYAADLVSGVLHWALDTWFDESVPAVRRIVLIVREHHVYPQQIFKYRWTHEFGIMSWFGLLLISGTWAVVAVTSPPAAVAVGAIVGGVVGSSGASFSLEMHKRGHAFAPSRPVRALQRAGLVLTPAHHMRHHRGEHDENYCIVNGWADRTLGRVGLFRLLERLVGVTRGSAPRVDDRRWRRAFGRSVRR